MPIDLNDAEVKQQFDAAVAEQAAKLAAEQAAAKLKEMGVDDHATKVISKANAEAKAHREAKEAAEAAAAAAKAEADSLKKAEAERKAAIETKAKEEAAAAAKTEDEKKGVNERFDAFQKRLTATVEEELAKRDADAARVRSDFQAELAKRDKQILMESVRAEAVKNGILYDNLVNQIDISEVTMDGGSPDRAKISELVEAHKAAFPKLYGENEEKKTTKGSEERKRDDTTGRFQTEASKRADPAKGTDTKTTVDWKNLKPDDFAEQERQLRARIRGGQY